MGLGSKQGAHLCCVYLLYIHNLKVVLDNMFVHPHSDSEMSHEVECGIAHLWDRVSTHNVLDLKAHFFRLGIFSL